MFKKPEEEVKDQSDEDIHLKIMTEISKLKKLAKLSLHA
jgi:hypothetical protein